MVDIGVDDAQIRIQEIALAPTTLGSSPVRVLHIIHRMRPGGEQTLVMNIYRKIDRKIIQFDFAVRSKQTEFYDDEIESLGGKIYRLPWTSGNPTSVFAYQRGLAKLLRNSGPFVAVHSHPGFFSGQTLPVAAEADIPIRIAHGHSASTSPTPILRRGWMWHSRRKILSSATHLLACSEPAGQSLFSERWSDDPRAQILPNAIDLSLFQNFPTDKLAIRNQLDLPSGHPLIGHVGRFDAVKNHGFLIEVFSSIQQEHPTAQLLLVGEGELRPEMETLVKSKGLQDHVHFLGIRQDVPQILEALDLFILPSHHEGLATVVIEAQAAGAPCLVSTGVPAAADLGMGLVRHKDLQDGPNVWATDAQENISQAIPPWNDRLALLKAAGYDIHSVVRQLGTIYTGAVNSPFQGEAYSVGNNYG